MKFIYPIKITFTPSVIYVYDAELDYEHQIEPKYLQKWTGLLDKQNKEIYKGDIVRGINGWEDKKYEKSVNYLPELYIVEWENAGFVCVNKDGEYVHLNSYWWEILGNVYENPELIVKK